MLRYGNRWQEDPGGLFDNQATSHSNPGYLHGSSHHVSYEVFLIVAGFFEPRMLDSY